MKKRCLTRKEWLIEHEVERMIQVLVDKGHSLEYAKTIAPLDKEDLDAEVPQGSPMFECSVCRGNFTPLQWRYHYHPCE